MLTSKSIGRAINEKFGIDGIRVFTGGGCCSFYSDTNDEAMIVLMSGEASVYVYRMNHLSLDSWLEHFKDLWNNSAPTRIKIK